MACQISFGITSKHRCAIHSHMFTYTFNTKAHFSDNSYQNHMKIFLLNSKKEINQHSFWQKPEDISQNSKDCQHCRFYDNTSFNSSLFQQIPIWLKHESSLNNKLQHHTDINFFNRIQKLHLDQPAQCLQHPNKTHSK